MTQGEDRRANAVSERTAVSRGRAALAIEKRYIPDLPRKWLRFSQGRQTCGSDPGVNRTRRPHMAAHEPRLAASSSGNPAILRTLLRVMSTTSLRPEALRPRLTTGLPLR